jgi:tRNA(Ile2) C34 agmatinyltransferase TiaS
MRIYVGIDDTDSLESRGTGRLARGIAEELSRSYGIYGVTRHQLYVHPDIPFTSHNSSAVIHLDAPADADLQHIFDSVKALMLADFIEGSDPGLVVAPAPLVTPGVVAFGMDAKRTIVTQARARSIAATTGILCEGLGGTEGGVIGAVAGIGLASTGNDGRFLMKGRSRELKGSIRRLAEVLEAGIDRVMTMEGKALEAGEIDLAKSANPSFVQGKAVLFVEPVDGHYLALKRV